MFDATSTRHWLEAGSEGSPSKRFLLGDTRESVSLNDSSMEELSEDDKGKLIFPWEAASLASGELMKTGKTLWLAEFATSRPPLIISRYLCCLLYILVSLRICMLLGKLSGSTG
jgi:hypothetical protein